MRGGKARKLTWIASGVVVLVVAVLVLAQLVLPGVAAQKVRERVARYGTVESASVKVSPAIKLLWGRVDSATVRARSLHITVAQAGDLLWSTRPVDHLVLSADSLQVGSLKLSDVSLSKRGNALSAQASASEADLHASLPAGMEIQPVASGGGQVEVQATGGLFGLQASVRALVSAQQGQLVVQPEGLLGGLGRITLFADPRVLIQGVGVSREPNGAGFQLRIRARLR
jgi:hypothetical protein